MSDDEMELPYEVALAWGRDERSRRGPRPGLSLDRITAAAIAIADAEGFGAVSMSRVASELGFTTMSLYRYVESKDQLLTLMVDSAIGPAPKQQSAGQDWRAGLTTWAQGLTAAYLAHPWALDIPIRGAPVLPNQLDWMDWALAILAETPLAPWERISAILLLSGYARNESRMAVELQQGQAESGRTQAEEDAYYSRTLSLLVPPERMPALHALVSSGLFADTMTLDTSDDELFYSFGLERVLDGLEHYMQRLERAHDQTNQERLAIPVFGAATGEEPEPGGRPRRLEGER